MGSTPNYRQRAVILILIAGCLLLLGLSWLKPALVGTWFVVYWLGCLAFTMASMVSALWEFRAIRHQLREDQLDLLRHHFSDLPGHKEGMTVIEPAIESHAPTRHTNQGQNEPPTPEHPHP